MFLCLWLISNKYENEQIALLDKIAEMNPDVICFQETKAQDDQVAEVLNDLEGYYFY